MLNTQFAKGLLANVQSCMHNHMHPQAGHEPPTYLKWGGPWWEQWEAMVRTEQSLLRQLAGSAQ